MKEYIVINQIFPIQTFEQTKHGEAARQAYKSIPFIWKRRHWIRLFLLVTSGQTGRD